MLHVCYTVLRPMDRFSPTADARVKGDWGILTPLLTPKLKVPREQNFAVIVRHISTKNQQLDFSNFHCSVVCSYCSIWCLIIKSGSKMVKMSNASYENEIHVVDSPFKEDSKNIIFWPGRP